MVSSETVGNILLCIHSKYLREIIIIIVVFVNVVSLFIKLYDRE